MSADAWEKIGIVSHVLPPLPSGQSMVLYRLLCQLPGKRYFLISTGSGTAIADVIGSEKLKARYYYLKKVLQAPVVDCWVFNIIVFFNALWGIYGRSKQIEKIAGKERCALLISCTGDLYDLPAAYLACKRLGIAFIPYIFDDYANQWTGFKRRLARWMEPLLLKGAKTVIVPNEFMQREYVERYGIVGTVFHNPCPMPNLDELDNLRKVFDLNEISIVYTGAIYDVHHDAFRNLLAAIQQMGRNDIKLHLFTAQSLDELAQHGISGPAVVYHPHIAHDEVAVVLRQADILFLPLAFVSDRQEVIRSSAPGKTGEYLAVGRPILVHAPCDSFVSWYFREHGCGMVVDRNDPVLLEEELSRLIVDPELRERLGTSARIAAEKDFNIDRIRGRFADFIASCEGTTHEL